MTQGRGTVRRTLVSAPPGGAGASPAAAPQRKPAAAQPGAPAPGNELDDIIPAEGSRSTAAPPPEKAGAKGADRPWQARGPWGVIVEEMEAVNVRKEYEQLRDELTLGENATEYGVVLDAMNRAESNTFKALRLARMAKIEEQRVDLECNDELETIRRKAREDIERERHEAPEAPAAEEDPVRSDEPPAPKARGKKADAKPKGRAPTIQDLEDRMLRDWPKLYKELNHRKAEAHATRAMMEGLHERWVSRCATLRVITERVSPVGTRY